MGIELLVAMLVGVMALVGVASGGDDGDDSGTAAPLTDEENTDELIESNDDVVSDDGGDRISDDDIAEDGVDDAPRDTLEGTDDADELWGDDLIGDISGADGDDLIVSFGANGVLYGGDGDDVVALTSGVGTLTGGTGADVFVVMGDENDDNDTQGVITDFDPDEDKLLFTFQQSTVASGDVQGNPTTVVLEREEIETDSGIATKLTFGPAAGFDDSTQGIGFASVTLEGVTLDAFSETNVIVGRDSTPDDDGAQVNFIDDLATAMTDYDDFEIGTVEADTITSSFGEDSTVEAAAVFGLGGDDRLIGEAYDDVDLFGGDGDDSLYGGLGTGDLFGGDGDDLLSTETTATLTGGEGADRFSVSRDEVETDTPTVITDFDVSEDTLSLSAVLFGLVNDPEGGIGSVSLEDAVHEGVSGALVKTFVEDPEGTIGYGPTVFLEGVTAADIPDGTFRFDAIVI